MIWVSQALSANWPEIAPNATTGALSWIYPQRRCRFPPAAEGALYRIVQEALTNIERHADAQAVRVHLATRGTDIRLQITDDGIGYRPDDVVQAEHFGVNGMVERAEMVGGTLQVDSRVEEVHA